MCRSDSARRSQASNRPSDARTRQEPVLSRSEAASAAARRRREPGRLRGRLPPPAGHRQVDRDLLVRADRASRTGPGPRTAGPGPGRTGAASGGAAPSRPTYPSTTRSAATSGGRSWPRASRFIPRTSKMSAKSARKSELDRRVDRGPARDSGPGAASGTPPARGSVRTARCRVPSGTSTRPSRSRSGLVRATESWSFSSRTVDPRKNGGCPSSSRIRQRQVSRPLVVRAPPRPGRRA